MVLNAALSPSSLQGGSWAPPFAIDPTWQQAGAHGLAVVRRAVISVRPSCPSVSRLVSRGFHRDPIRAPSALRLRTEYGSTLLTLYKAPRNCALDDKFLLRCSCPCVAVVLLHSHSGSWPTRGHRVRLEPSVIGWVLTVQVLPGMPLESAWQTWKLKPTLGELSIIACRLTVWVTT